MHYTKQNENTLYTHFKQIESRNSGWCTVFKQIVEQTIVVLCVLLSVKSITETIDEQLTHCCYFLCAICCNSVQQVKRQSVKHNTQSNAIPCKIFAWIYSYLNDFIGERSEHEQKNLIFNFFCR